MNIKNAISTTITPSSIIPIRVLLCSYKCFNEQGLDYYGVAFA